MNIGVITAPGMAMTEKKLVRSNFTRIMLDRMHLFGPNAKILNGQSRRACKTEKSP